MGRHHRKRSSKATHTAVLAITLLSAFSPVAFLGFTPRNAEATSPSATQALPVALPNLPLDRALAQAKLVVPTTSTTTPTGKLDKDGNPVETTKAVPVRRTSPTTTRTTTSTRPKQMTTTTRSSRTSSVPTTTRRITPTTTTPSPTPKPTTTTRTTQPTSTTTQTRTAQPTTSTGRTAGLGLAPSAARATEEILQATGFTGNLIGRAQRPSNPTSDHPRGYAADFMTTNLAMGNKIRDYALANKTRLGVKYVIWQAPDHYNHVHISFLE